MLAIRLIRESNNEVEQLIIETKRFGSMEIEEKNIIEIVGGVLGFEQYSKYVIIDHDVETPYKWLQSVDEPELAFVIIDPFIFLSDYQFDLSESEIKLLDLTKSEEILVVVILVVPEDPKKMSANLKAPIILNQLNRKGKQIVLNNEGYPIKYFLFQ